MEIKRILTFVDEVRAEAGRRSEPPLRKSAVVAIVQNPFAGRYAEDLSPLTAASEVDRPRNLRDCGGAAGARQTRELRQGGDGRAGGRAGAWQCDAHDGLRQRDARSRGGGKAWISSFTKRAAPGATIDIPLAHKDALYVRSHYDGISITLHDAPQADEIAVICAYATRGRPNHQGRRTCRR